MYTIREEETMRKRERSEGWVRRKWLTVGMY